MKRTAFSVAIAGIMLMSAVVPGRSQDEAQLEPDASAGEALAERCVECHGADGLGRVEGVPHLAGQHYAYLRRALGEYKNDERSGEAMREVVASLSEQDMADLAGYFAGLKPFSGRRPDADEHSEEAQAADTDPFASVREATAICAGCHGEDGNSELPGTPSIAGQHVNYLITAMQAYRDGTRSEPTMRSFAESLSDAEIEEMAYFYAAQDPKRSKTPFSGDPLAGMAATAPCAVCHGADGNTDDPDTPRLAGLDAEYLETAANAYRNGAREHAAMQEAIGELRLMDTKDMAAHYASGEPMAIAVRKPLTTAEWVERCERCHGAAGNSTDPRFPILAGQDRDYLANALKLYHVNERASSVMQAMSFLMGESDIERLASYYARQRRP